MLSYCIFALFNIVERLLVSEELYRVLFLEFPKNDEIWFGIVDEPVALCSLFKFSPTLGGYQCDVVLTYN
jgi:hypothetical protein